jgi:hypothetical protein
MALVNQQSDLNVFCYDYGYLALDDCRCLIVKSRVDQNACQDWQDG